MAPESSPPRLSLSFKGRLMKSACSSFRYNPRNMENPWYGLWTLELLKLTQSFNNIVLIPQYALWYTLPELESDVESIEEIDEDDISEDGEQDEGSDENNAESDSSDDEINLFKDPDESGEAIRVEDSEVPDIERDPDTSLAESLLTIPDGSAPHVIPDFVALHIRAEKLNFPSKARHKRRYEQRAGYRIIHECCPLVVEIKAFPTRRLTPGNFRRTLSSRLANAIQDLGTQCYHLFKMYEHALRTIVIAASGDYWTHRIVTRSDVPRATADGLDSEVWDDLDFPSPVVLGTTDSDRRMKEIADYIRAVKPAQAEK
jgi:hypothetical protein